MPFRIGQAITGPDFERETRQWPVERFTALCDSIMGVMSCWNGRPSFTSRINVPDDGVDAALEIRPDEILAPVPFIVPGWNVFQYKKRDVLVRGNKVIVAELFKEDKSIPEKR